MNTVKTVSLLTLLLLPVLCSISIYSMDSNVTGNHTDIFQAINKGSSANIQKIINTGTDINVKDKKGETPLHYATIKGDLTIVQTLLRYGAKVNSKDKLCFTPLHYAVKGGHIPIIQVLIAAGANLNESNNCIPTPLHLAQMFKNQPMVTTILEDYKQRLELAPQKAKEKAKNLIHTLLLGTNERLGIKSPCALLNTWLLQELSQHIVQLMVEREIQCAQQPRLEQSQSQFIIC